MRVSRPPLEGEAGRQAGSCVNSSSCRSSSRLPTTQQQGQEAARLRESREHVAQVARADAEVSLSMRTKFLLEIYMKHVRPFRVAAAAAAADPALQHERAGRRRERERGERGEEEDQLNFANSGCSKRLLRMVGRSLLSSLAENDPKLNE